MTRQASDLFNLCAVVDIDAIKTIDAGDAEHCAAFIFADNCHELYVNGTLMVGDPVFLTVWSPGHSMHRKGARSN